MDEEKKPGLFDKLKQGVDDALGKAAPKSPAGPLPGTSTRPVRTNSPGTAPLRSAPTRRLDTFERSRALPGTAPLPSAAIPTGPDPALSSRRLAIIDDYMMGRNSIPQLKDPMFMYIVVSDERVHQIQVLKDTRQALKALPPTDLRAGALLQQQADAEKLVVVLFKVLKRITGKRGPTGGTGELFQES